MKLFKSILYVAGATADEDAALARAASLAGNNQARLTVIDVIAPLAPGGALPAGGPGPAELHEYRLAERRKALESRLAPYQNLDIRVEVRTGHTSIEAIRAVLRDGHDLVLKRAEDPRWIDRLFGSDDMHLLRTCPCPVWLLKPAEPANYASIVAAVDFDAFEPASITQELNRRLLDLAGSLALSDFAALHVVHAWEAPAETLLRTWSDTPDEAASNYVEGERLRHQNALDRLQDHLRGELDPKAYEYLAPRFHLVHGPAATTIPEQAARLNADLVVMGTVARTGVSGWLIGNTAETILDQLECSVLAVKPPGFTSPVKLDA